VDYHEDLLLPHLAFFTASSPTRSSSPPPSARTTPSASHLRYSSPCNINQRAKGTGLIH
jgi:hypothetical protein